MFQQTIAIIIIAAIVARIIILKKNKKITASEFVFWLIFWSVAAILIAGIRWIDKFVAGLGFSGSGIEVLLYLAVAVLFYFNFRLRLKVEKMDNDITKIVRRLALDEEDPSKDKRSDL